MATSTQGWAAFGHPEWGSFKLGKTNPNFSTSGLSALIAQNYAATGKTRDLTTEDLAKAQVEQYNRSVESSVVHYGDTTLTFLNNWYRADQEGTALTYVSAVAVEEKSVIDYNTGNPDGVLDPGEEPRPPRIPLVALYPKEGTLFSDNPFFVLDAPWVTPRSAEARWPSRTTCSSPRTSSGCSSSTSGPATPRCRSRRRSSRRTASTPTNPRRCCRSPRRR